MAREIKEKRFSGVGEINIFLEQEGMIDADIINITHSTTNWFFPLTLFYFGKR